MKRNLVSRMPLSQILLLSLTSFIVFINSSCTKTKNIQYITDPDQANLLALKGKTVVILSVRYNKNAFAGKPLSTAVVQPLLENHKLAFQNQFSNLFNFKVLSDTELNLLANSDLELNNNITDIRKVIEYLKVDGAVIINCAYAFSDESASNYSFASNTNLIDKEGRVLWSFYGKAWKLQSVGEILSPGEFVRQLEGESLPGAFVSNMNAMSEGYISYIEWLTERDMEGSLHNNYFIDYPDEKKRKYILIYPASLNEQAPYVFDSSAKLVTK